MSDLNKLVKHLTALRNKAAHERMIDQDEIHYVTELIAMEDCLEKPSSSALKALLSGNPPQQPRKCG